MTKYALSLILLFLLPLNAAFAKTFMITSSDLSFVATGKPGFLRINGKKGQLAGKLGFDNQFITGSFTADLERFETGIETRDKHMKETYLETKKFPTATLELEPIAYQGSSLAYSGDYVGKLTLHGVKKEVKGKLSFEPKGGQTIAQGDFEFLLSDFGIEIPSYLGIKVADKVNITTTFTIEEQPK